MSEFDIAFFERMRDFLESERDWFGMHEDNTVECLKDAFEAAQNPPKPEEPRGWGAVVEDNTGAYWTLIAPEAGQWRNYREGARGWSDINAVRVLSEGVQP